jgi:hypothetical protein
MPTEEEIAACKRFKGSVGDLSDVWRCTCDASLVTCAMTSRVLLCCSQAEKFVVAVCDVPNLRSRIEGFVAQEKFPGKHFDIDRRIRLLHFKCSQVSRRVSRRHVFRRHVFRRHVFRRHVYMQHVPCRQLLPPLLERSSMLSSSGWCAIVRRVVGGNADPAGCVSAEADADAEAGRREADAEGCQGAHARIALPSGTGAAPAAPPSMPTLRLTATVCMCVCVCVCVCVRHLACALVSVALHSRRPASTRSARQ